MKRHTILILCLTSIWMSSCEQQNTDNNAANERVSSISIRSILEALPPEAFDNTTEGISREELDVLNQKLESENWKATLSGPNRLTIESRRPKGSSILIHTYGIGSDVVLVCQTSNEGHSSAETWSYGARDKIASKKQFLPVISINDFYAEADKVAEPERYSGNVVVVLNEDGTLAYDVVAWMESSLENKPKAYDIAADWDGTKFKVTKTKG